MVDFITISKKLALGCSIFLALFMLNLIVSYKILHSNNKNFYNSNMFLINDEIPKFNLPLLNNPQISIDQDALKNKVTLISIWSSNCRFCRHQHQTLLSIAKYLQGKEVNFIGVNCKDFPEQANKWLSSKGDPYSINLLDQRGALVTDLKANSLPDLLIIDSYGRVRYRYSGAITKKIWEENIRPIVERLYLANNKYL